MQFEAIKDPILKETLYKGKHQSGLTVYVLPKEGFSKSYAAFATRYGSVDSDFIPVGEQERIQVPDGIAHFLEHKLFEQPDGTNAFDAYSQTGASANAFTSSDMTVYLFSSTDRYYDNLEILLDFVTSPYFTDENVSKEQGIIGQEIRMYDDDPEWRVFFNMLEAMYVNHPVRKDTAGTVESISHITPEILYRCYHTFYHPSNMILFTCGDVEPEQVAKLVDKYIKEGEPAQIKRFTPDEPAQVNQAYIEQKLSVSAPLFSLGFKDTDVGYGGLKLLKKEIETSILLEMLFGEGSDLYQTLYDQGLINDSFGSNCECEKEYGFSAIGGESPDPEKLRDIVLDALDQAPLTQEDFERSKRVEQGDFLRMWNSVENLSNNMISYLFRDIDVFQFSKVCREITFEDIQARFNRLFKRENCVLSVIKPY
jgi:predicted Zn-dependent peptidase